MTAPPLPTSRSTGSPLQPPARINLLPEAVFFGQVLRRRAQSWGAGLIVTVGLVGGVWVWAQARGTEIRQIRAVLAAELAEIRQAQKNEAALAARTEVMLEQQALLDLMRSDDSWACRLAELAAAVPDEAVLRRIEVASPADATTRPPPAVAPPAARPAPAAPLAETPEPVEIRIEGYAADHQALAAFLRRLQQAGGYSEVRLVRSAAAANGPAGCLDFGIACRR